MTRGSADVAGLRLPKVDIEHAGTTAHHLFPRDVCLVREEYVFRFHFSHNVRVPLRFPMTKMLSPDDLIHLDGVWRKELEDDYCVPRLHTDAGPSCRKTTCDSLHSGLETEYSLRSIEGITMK